LAPVSGSWIASAFVPGKGRKTACAKQAVTCDCTVINYQATSNDQAIRASCASTPDAQQRDEPLADVFEVDHLLLPSFVVRRTAQRGDESADRVRAACR